MGATGVAARVWARVRVGTASWAWDVGRLRRGCAGEGDGTTVWDRGETGSRAGVEGRGVKADRDAPSEEVRGLAPRRDLINQL